MSRNERCCAMAVANIKYTLHTVHESSSSWHRKFPGTSGQFINLRNCQWMKLVQLNTMIVLSHITMQFWMAIGIVNVCYSRNNRQNKKKTGWYHIDNIKSFEYINNKNCPAMPFFFSHFSKTESIVCGKMCVCVSATGSRCHNITSYHKWNKEAAIVITINGPNSDDFDRIWRSWPSLQNVLMYRSHACGHIHAFDSSAQERLWI